MTTEEQNKQRQAEIEAREQRTQEIKKLSEELSKELSEDLKKSRFTLKFGEQGVTIESESFGSTAEELAKLTLEVLGKLNKSPSKKNKTNSYFG